MIKIRYNEHDKIEIFNDEGIVMATDADSINAFNEMMKSQEMKKEVMEQFSLEAEPTMFYFIGDTLRIANIKMN